MRSQAIIRVTVVFVLASLWLGLGLPQPTPVYAGAGYTWTGDDEGWCSGTWGDDGCWERSPWWPVAGPLSPSDLIFPYDAGDNRTATNAWCFSTMLTDHYYLDSLTFTGSGYLVNQLEYCAENVPLNTASLSSDGGITDSSTQDPHWNELSLDLELDGEKTTPITVADASQTLRISGWLGSGSSAQMYSLRKEGAGTLEFTIPDDWLYGWPMMGVESLTINGGTVRTEREFWQGTSLDAPGLATPVTVNAGTLTGDGQVGDVFAEDGGAIQGEPTLTTGSLHLFNGSTVRVRFGPSGPSRLQVNGTVYIYPGARLELDVQSALCLGRGYTIISSMTAVGGTFEGLPEGSVITADGHDFQITYRGGDGHDVVLVPVQAPQITEQPQDVEACWWYEPDPDLLPDMWRPRWKTPPLIAEALAGPEPTVSWYNAAGDLHSYQSPDYFYCGTAYSVAGLGVFSDQRSFYAVFENDYGSATTRTATVTGHQAAQVDCWEWPENQTVQAGDTVTLKSCFQGDPAPSIQWQEKAPEWIRFCVPEGGPGSLLICEYCHPSGSPCQPTKPNSDWTDIPGADQTTYVFTAQSEQDGYSFRAGASNLCGTDYTRAAKLTVLPAGSGNKAPVAGDLTVTTDEDTAVAITLVASDADGDDLTYAVTVAPEYGTLSGTAPDLTYTPDPGYDGADDFTYRANDGTADSNLASVGITVNPVNHLPAVDAGGPYSGAEGTAITLGGASASDADGDSLTYSWIDSTPVCYFGDPTALHPQFYCYDEGATGSYQVTLTVDDGGGQLVSSQATVNMSNVPPVVYASPDLSGIFEADPLVLRVATFHDDGHWDGHTSTIDWGDGTTESGGVGSTGILGAVYGSHLYLDNGTYSVEVCVSDHDGGSDCDSMNIEVANVAPVVTASPDLSGDEGDPLYLEVASFFDAGATDGHTATIDWGDGTPVLLGEVHQIGQRGIVKGRHTYADSGTYVGEVCVGDLDGGSDCDDLSITVANVAPTVTLSGPSSADEGETRSYSYTAADPGDDTLSVPDGYPNCGAGGIISNQEFNTATGTGRFDCTFPNGAAWPTVSVAVQDSDGDSSEDALEVLIANIAPQVTLEGPDSANEGDTAYYTFSTSDPGDETFELSGNLCAAGVLTDLQFDDTTGSGSFYCTFPDGPFPVYEVQVIVTDDGTAGQASLSVSVANVAPQLVLTGPDTAKEGETEAYSFSTTDPGDDTFGLLTGYPTCGANGTISNQVFDTATGAGSFDCTFPDGDATSSVAVQLQDSDGAASNVDSLTVNIENVAPTVTLSGQSSANEGETKSYGYTATDPGDETFSLLADYPTCGANGTISNEVFDTATGAGSFDCTFPNGDATYEVAVRVADSDGATGNIDTITVHVANVAPTVTLNGQTSANEGETKSYSYTVADPGDETFSLPAGYPTCGANGTISNEVFDTATGAGSFDCTFPNGDATYEVAVRVADSDGATGNVDTITVHVANVAPAVTLNGQSSANEGETKSYSYTAADPGDETFSLPMGYPNCGANGTISNEDFDTATGAGGFDCTFPDGPASSTVTVRVSDGDDLSNEAHLEVVVANAPPTVVLAGPLAADEGDTKHYTYSTSDPGDDTIGGVSPDCEGDATPSNHSFDETTGTGSFDCTFPDGGSSGTSYRVSVWVMDSDGAWHEDVLDVTVGNVAPEVWASPTSQICQYSDEICAVTFTATDVAADTMSASVSPDPLPDTLTLTANNDCSDSGGVKTCTWTLAGTMDQLVGDYGITLRVTDDDGASGDATHTITVLHEDANIWLDGENPVDVEVDTPGGNSGPFSLIAYAQETTPDGADCGADPGDINDAAITMTLVAVGPGDSLTVDCDWISDNGKTSYERVSTFECSFENVAVNTYHVQATVVGDYYASGVAEDVLVVYDPSLGFTTGGGWFYWPGSEDLENGYPGDKTNFGYTMKYNKKATNVQGSLLLIRHTPEGNYRVKSNVLYGLSLGEAGDPIYGWASFSGKCTYQDKTWEEPIGNHEFLVYVEDHGVPGRGVDQFWIEIRDGAGDVIYVMSMRRDALENTMPLQNGNIVVPH